MPTSDVNFVALDLDHGILFETLRRPRAEALDFASKGFASCMLSPEGLEGIAAFVEKRNASWNK